MDMSQDLLDEIKYRQETYDESTEEGDTLTFIEACDDILNVIVGRDKDAQDRRWEKQIRLFFIDKGIYREITEDEIQDTITIGGKCWDFKLNRKKYVFETWNI